MRTPSFNRLPMTITKAEILAVIDTDISDNETKLTSLMANGSMSTSSDAVQIANYTRTLGLLNSTKTWVENNL